jgi:hypothetical protein
MGAMKGVRVAMGGIISRAKHRKFRQGYKYRFIFRRSSFASKEIHAHCSRQENELTYSIGAWQSNKHFLLIL